MIIGEGSALSTAATLLRTQTGGSRDKKITEIDRETRKTASREVMNITQIPEPRVLNRQGRHVHLSASFSVSSHHALSNRAVHASADEIQAEFTEKDSLGARHTVAHVIVTRKCQHGRDDVGQPSTQ